MVYRLKKYYKKPHKRHNSIYSVKGILLVMILFSACATSAQNNKTKRIPSIYYVDAIEGSDTNTGLNIMAPWESLSRVNNIALKPGDKLLFKRGRQWEGSLHPSGSGNSLQPIIIGAYGKGNKPVIAGGGVENGSICLNNQQYIEIKNLSVTNYNPGEEAGSTLIDWEQKNQQDFSMVDLPPQVNNQNTMLFGIYIAAKDMGEVKHIHLTNIDVHGVNGMINQGEGSKNNGGIYFQITGTQTPTFFNDVLIDSCDIHDVDRTGITICNSTWSSRKLIENENWVPSLNIIIKHCKFSKTGANALIVRVAKNPIIEHNLFDHCAIKGSGNAVFSFNCDSALWQYNECRYTKANVGDRDAGGIDADYKTKYTILQYNYVHDNDYGMLVTGGPDNFNDQTIVRYNIFENDGKYAHPTHGKCIIRISGSTTNTKVYNNVIYVSDSQENTKIISHEEWKTSPANTTYQNNIFYNLSKNAYLDFEKSVGNNFNHNIYYGNAILNLTDTLSKKLNPLFLKEVLSRPPNYKLKKGSPAIGAGAIIIENTRYDYFGNKISKTKPNIGVYEGPGIK